MGRGEYYKNKYGGGGRGRGRGGGGGGADGGAGAGRGGRGGGGGGRYSSPASGYDGNNNRTTSQSANQQQRQPATFEDLKRLLLRIDGKQYPAYHDLEPYVWSHPSGFTLEVGRAQSDPYAPPTRCRVVVPRPASGLDPLLFQNKVRRIATADYLLRGLYASCRLNGADRSLSGAGNNNGGGGGGWSGPKGGDVQILEPTQHVLEQSAVQIDPSGNVQAQLTINLPARGRSILAAACSHIFERVLPRLIGESLVFRSLAPPDLLRHVNSVEDQVWLQHQLASNGLVAFVRNGAVLPRASGNDDRPMNKSPVLFHSPPSLEVGFELPHNGPIRGMGVPRGITLICGGGFHGKSTLLQALQYGVYPKVVGDGREYCVVSPQGAVKIRAEDGRAVNNVDISPFINNLPFDKDTKCFSTQDASGSTSQASNIVEVRTRLVRFFAQYKSTREKAGRIAVEL